MARKKKTGFKDCKGNHIHYGDLVEGEIRSIYYDGWCWKQGVVVKHFKDYMVLLNRPRHFIDFRNLLVLEHRPDILHALYNS
jgi:hypothetical protein